MDRARQSRCRQTPATLRLAQADRRNAPNAPRKAISSISRNGRWFGSGSKRARLGSVGGVPLRRNEARCKHSGLRTSGTLRSAPFLIKFATCHRMRGPAPNVHADLPGDRAALTERRERQAQGVVCAPVAVLPEVRHMRFRFSTPPRPESTMSSLSRYIRRAPTVRRHSACFISLSSDGILTMARPSWSAICRSGSASTTWPLTPSMLIMSSCDGIVRASTATPVT